MSLDSVTPAELRDVALIIQTRRGVATPLPLTVDTPAALAACLDIAESEVHRELEALRRARQQHTANPIRDQSSLELTVAQRRLATKLLLGGSLIATVVGLVLAIRKPPEAVVVTAPPPAPGRTAPTERTGRYVFSPIDESFKRQLAETVGPNPRKKVVLLSYILRGEQHEKVYPLNGLPDGYRFEGEFQSWFPLGGVGFTPRAIAIRSVDAPPDGMGMVSTSFPTRMPGLLVPNAIITRYGGRFYLCGWVASRTAVEKKLGFIFSYRRSATENVPLLLPITSPSGLVSATNGNIWGLRQFGSSHLGSERPLIPSGWELLFDDHSWEKVPEYGRFENTPPLPSASNETALRYYHSGFNASSKLVDFTALPEGTTFPVSSGALIHYLAESHTQIQVDYRPDLAGEWTIVRHNGRPYVRGWVAGPLNVAKLKGKNLLVSNTPENPSLGQSPQKLTLRLTSYSGAMTNQGGSQITLSNVVLDEYAHARW